jgi:hypothetical protein
MMNIFNLLIPTNHIPFNWSQNCMWNKCIYTIKLCCENYICLSRNQNIYIHFSFHLPYLSKFVLRNAYVVDIFIIIIIIVIQRMWNMKCFVIPVIIGATGIVSKSLQKYLKTIPGQHSIDSLQKNCHTRNITHHKESATSWDLKAEWWGSPLAQGEKYQGRKKTCDKKWW